MMIKSIFLSFCALCIPFTFYGCEQSETPIANSDIGSQVNGGQANGGQANGGTNTSGRPMCQEMNDHAGSVAACTSSGTLCTNESNIYRVRDCLLNEAEMFSTVSVECSSVDDCGVLAYGSCGEAVAIASTQAEVATELSCRLSSCSISLDYAIECLPTPSSPVFNQPVAACINNVCVVQEAQE